VKLRNFSTYNWKPLALVAAVAGFSASPSQAAVLFTEIPLGPQEARWPLIIKARWH
jgi:hypothetical protein